MYGKGKPVFLWLSDKRTKLASYRSVYQASKDLSADRRTINSYLDSGRLYRGEYYLTTTSEWSGL